MHQRTCTIDRLEPRQLFAALVPGKTVTTTISAIGQSKTWTLPLVAGRAVVVATGDTGLGSFATELSLLNPNGTVVATSLGDKGALISMNAPVTGTYTVRLRDVGNNQTGSARVTAFAYAGNITDSDDAYTAESGRRRASTIQPGDLDVWKINASSGQFLSVLATENSVGSSIGVGVQLIGPDGKLISQKISTKGAKLDVAGSKSGAYYAVIFEPGSDATGRYGISFAQTSAPQYSGDPDTATPLPSNTLRNGDLPGGDIDIFAINLSDGQSISATLKRTTGSLDPEMLLVNSAGKIVASVNGSTSATINTTASATGTYYLILRDREADDGGQYSIKYTLA